MVKWIANIKWGGVLLAGLLFTIISVIVRQIELIWTMSYYKMPEYFGVWSKSMMPTAGPPPFQFFLTSIIITFTTGVSIAVIYCYLKEYLPNGFWKRSTYFADLMTAAYMVFFTFPVFLLFNLPPILLIYWFLSTFITLILTSILIVKLVK